MIDVRKIYQNNFQKNYPKCEGKVGEMIDARKVATHPDYWAADTYQA